MTVTTKTRSMLKYLRYVKNNKQVKYIIRNTVRINIIYRITELQMTVLSNFGKLLTSDDAFV